MMLFFRLCLIFLIALECYSAPQNQPKAGTNDEKYRCECNEVESDDGQFTMQCHCKDLKNPQNDNPNQGPNGIEGTLPPNNGGNQGTEPPAPNGGKDEDDETCPFGCPPGWSRFGFSENCYLLPSQPAKLDTFWNQQARCKAAEKTAYVMVIDGIFEQAVATPVALQYSINWLAVLGNGFLWLGGYTNENGWNFLDGTDQTYNPLMIAANVIGSKKNNTCLGADIKTLGLWQTYPCTDKTGAAICEMPMRRVCGRQGSILPISPVSLSLADLTNLFPKLPSVPFIGQILGESALDDALTGVGNKLSDLMNWISGTETDEKSKCPMACPPGWVSSSLFVGEHCYLLPSQPAKLDTFWNTQEKCKKTEPTSYISIANGFMEQAIASAIVFEYAVNWIATGGTGHLWLGGYTTEKGWQFLDGSDQTSNILMTLANLVGPFKNNTCLAADIKTAGLWYTLPCSETTGTSFCEMPKRPVCGPQGDLLPISPINLDANTLKNLFPRMPSIPFIGQVLGGKSWDDILFNPHEGQIYNLSGQKYGDATTHVICAKSGSGLLNAVNGRPDWTWLYIDNEEVDVPGKWTQQKCGGKAVDAFRIMPATYLSLWSHCKNMGYEVAQPANNRFSGWYPFQVVRNFTSYYRENSGWFGKLTATYEKVERVPIDQC